MQKLIMTDKSILMVGAYQDKAHHKLFVGWNDSLASSYPIYGSPISGMFKNAPVFWDAADSLVIQINLYTDGSDMTFSQIRRYNINALIRKKEKDLEQYIFHKTLIDNTGIPFEIYIRRIHFREDTLKGPLYFDFCITPDSLLLFSYLADSKTIEVWNFVRYPLLSGRKTTPETAQKIRDRKKKWELIRTIPITLNGPFNIIHTRGKNYLISHTGEIMRLNHSNAEKTGNLPENIRNGVLVVDKNRDAVYYVEQEVVQKNSGNALIAKIQDTSTQILEDR
jgi:hypothetical protein